MCLALLSWMFDLLVLRERELSQEGYINGLAQDCDNSSVLAMELLQSFTKPST